MVAKRPLRKATTARTSLDDVNLTDEENEGDEVTSPEETEVEDTEVEEKEDDTSDGESSESNDETAKLEAAYQQRFPGAPRDGAVFEAGEDVIIKGRQQGDLIVVQEPVFRATKAPGSERWRFHLLYSRGATISKGRTKQLGKPKTDEEKTQAWPYTIKDSGYITA